VAEYPWVFRHVGFFRFRWCKTLATINNEIGGTTHFIRRLSRQELNAGGLPRAHCGIPYEGFHMKRSVILGMVLGFATMVTVGCDKTSTVVQKETVTTPGGSTTTTDTHKVESSGNKAPTNSNGEKAN
jgi:hypothetical protein